MDQKAGSFDSRYKFSAKEKDDETQYSYFRARYYDSDLSVWLSMDPLSDKYPSTSGYAYCENNPVVFFDPNGEFKTRFGAVLFAATHGGGEINKAKGGNYSGQYYVQQNLPARKMTNHGTRQVKNQDRNVAGTFQNDEIGVGVKISYGWGSFGQGSSKRNIFERVFDWIWDGFKSVDDYQRDVNKTPVQTNDPYPNQSVEDLNNPFLDPNMNPNTSDKKYNDGGNFNQNDPAGTQNRPKYKYKIDTVFKHETHWKTGDTIKTDTILIESEVSDQLQ